MIKKPDFVATLIELSNQSKCGHIVFNVVDDNENYVDLGLFSFAPSISGAVKDVFSQNISPDDPILFHEMHPSGESYIFPLLRMQKPSQLRRQLQAVFRDG